MKTNGQYRVSDQATETVRRLTKDNLRKAGLSKAKVDAYRHGAYSIRLRVIDPAFHNKSVTERDQMTTSLFDGLAQEIDRDVSLVLLLSPQEAKEHFMNEEFEHPTAPVAVA